jgi:hypothetical protein
MLSISDNLNWQVITPDFMIYMESFCALTETKVKKYKLTSPIEQIKRLAFMAFGF